MRGLRASLPRFHLHFENEKKMGSPWVAGTSLKMGTLCLLLLKFFLIFFTEGNEGNEGAAALSIGCIFADFLADGGAMESLEHPSFSSFASVKFFEQEDAEV